VLAPNAETQVVGGLPSDEDALEIGGQRVVVVLEDELGDGRPVLGEAGGHVEVERADAEAAVAAVLRARRHVDAAEGQ
jgi:hypothetical protein